MVELNIRQRTEARENSLSPYASKSAESLGRMRWEEPCPLRTSFQRDRDRIIHSLAFRRLKHKTQVFIAPFEDHYVTRLTHTLEVSQIARTISRALNLNEDLTESIALGHDLGHTPYGHTGEEVLNELFPGGFRHNDQSLRVVDILEKNGQGLNLTQEVRDGIRQHSKSALDILGNGWMEMGTVEGQVVRISDLVAYINHDIGDAIRAGVIKEDDLPEKVIEVLGTAASRRINTLVMDIVAHTLRNWDNLYNGKPLVGMSPSILEIANSLREFLFDRVYNSKSTSRNKDNAKNVIIVLYEYYCRHEEELPEIFHRCGDGIERNVTDYIAGMTDNYALQVARRILKKEQRKYPRITRMG